MWFNRSGLMVVALGGALAAPSAAQAGFFEQLFGVAPQPSPYESGQTYEVPSRPQRAPHHVRKHVADAKPDRQKATDIFHDPSLRPGDAVMMKDGMHVFEGDRGSSHERDDFVTLEASQEVRGKDRAALAALDTTRNDPLRGHAVKPDTLASGRSAAVGVPVSPGYRITDARGDSVRYVGP